MTADKGTIFGGDTYSDYLAPSQIDYYTVSLIVGVTYTVDVSSASTELVYSLVGPQSFVATSGYVNAGQQIAYTPTVSGDYLFGLETANGMAGSYTFTAGSSQVPGPSQRPDTSGTTSSPSSTTLAVSQAAGNANPPPLSRTFTVQDATTGQTVPGYGNSFTDITPDSLNINTQVENAFITSGTGNDIIDAQGGGTNVLNDTGGVVNFESGSTTGNNAFFLDAFQNPVTWNTIANFHKDDFAVIYM